MRRTPLPRGDARGAHAVARTGQRRCTHWRSAFNWILTMGTGFKAPGATRRDAPASRTSPALASNQRTRPHGGRGTRPHGLPAERMEVATHHKPEDMSAVTEHALNHTAVKMATSTEFFLTEANRHTPDEHVDSLETSAELGIERVRGEQFLNSRAHAGADRLVIRMEHNLRDKPADLTELLGGEATRGARR